MKNRFSKMLCTSSILSVFLALSAPASLACSSEIEAMALIGKEDWPEPASDVNYRDLPASLFDRPEERFQFEYEGTTYQAVKLDENEQDGAKQSSKVRPPVPNFPSSLAAKGVSGLCEVKFDLTVEGEILNVQAACTHKGFIPEAERAVERAALPPATVHGHAVSLQDVIYPLSFCLM